MTLKECLDKCLVVELRAMVRQHGVRLQCPLKDDMISQLHPAIVGFVTNGGHRTQLPECAQSALAAILDAGGSMPLDVVESRYGELRKASSSAIESNQPWSDGLATPLDHLHTWGLLFRIRSPQTPGEVAAVPVDVAERLRPAGVSRPRVFRSCAAPAVAGGAPSLLCPDVMLLASALHDNPAPRLAAGGLSRRDIFRLNGHLLSPDDITDARKEISARAFYFLRSLAEGLTVIAVGDGRFRPGPGLEEWLTVTPGQRWRMAVAAYPDLAVWSELYGIPAIQFTTPPQPATLAAARRFLLQLLAEADPGEWCSFSSLVQAARLRNSFLLRKPDDGVAVRCAESGRDLTPKDWSLVEGAWIEACVKGPLNWLGLVEPGRTRRGEIVAFRVNADAVALLQAMSDPEALPVTAASLGSTSIVVESDMTVRVSVGGDLSHWFRIERMCDLVERGPVSRYRISREKVRQRLQAGETPESIVSTLGEDVPAPVTETIASWTNRFGQVRVFTTTVLSAAEPALLNELKSSPEIASCLGQSLGSRASAVQPGKEEDVVNILRSQGEMPHVELAAAAGLSPEVWREIRQGLLLWKQSSRKSGAPGPSDATLKAVESLTGGGADEAVETGGKTDATPGATLTLLEEAIRRKRRIMFDYQDPEGRDTERLVVQPHGMGQQKGITYLQGYKKGGGVLARFRVDCIQNIIPTA